MSPLCIYKGTLDKTDEIIFKLYCQMLSTDWSVCLIAECEWRTRQELAIGQDSLLKKSTSVQWWPSPASRSGLKSNIHLEVLCLYCHKKIKIFNALKYIYESTNTYLATYIFLFLILSFKTFKSTKHTLYQKGYLKNSISNV